MENKAYHMIYRLIIDAALLYFIGAWIGFWTLPTIGNCIP
jgi:hypothetical protein